MSIGSFKGTSGKHRSTPKQDEIVATLRARITSGRYKRSRRMPSQSQLAREFSVSSVTVQLALSKLARQGFVHARRPHGTFVADNPPHLSRYALVFWNDPVAPHAHLFWTRYYTALSQEAMRLRREGHDLELFHGINEHADSDDRQRLISQIESHRLAGLIFANHPYLVHGTPILDWPGLPRVAVTNEIAQAGVQLMITDETMWLRKALDHVVTTGRRRVAILSFGFGEGRQSAITDTLAERGLTCPDHWRQDIHPRSQGAARNCIALMMHASQKDRPDALLILDDNLTEEALAGLLASGVRVPEDIVVVSHANFPWVPTRILPVKWLGYDVRQMLLTAISLIDRERRGESVPAKTILPAVFEEEIQISAESNRVALSRTQAGTEVLSNR